MVFAGHMSFTVQKKANTWQKSAARYASFEINCYIHPGLYYNHEHRITKNRPLALRGHVTSFLWKWKLHDFAFESLLVDHFLNKIIVIRFFKPAPFAENEKVRSWSRDQNLIFKIMNYRFLTHILHLNFMENIENMMW